MNYEPNKQYIVKNKFGRSYVYLQSLRGGDWSPPGDKSFAMKMSKEDAESLCKKGFFEMEEVAQQSGGGV